MRMSRTVAVVPSSNRVLGPCLWFPFSFNPRLNGMICSPRTVWRFLLSHGLDLFSISPLEWGSLCLSVCSDHLLIPMSRAGDKPVFISSNSKNQIIQDKIFMGEKYSFYPTDISKLSEIARPKINMGKSQEFYWSSFRGSFTIQSSQKASRLHRTRTPARPGHLKNSGQIHTLRPS